jgi:hypothetical protein
MTDKNLPSVEYLRKRLRYEPETGKLFWLDCEDMPNCWRAKWSGKAAFTAVGFWGYRIGAINNVSFLAHRISYALHHGNWPSDQIDHINGVRDDNRIANLRVVSPQENLRNASMRSDNTSGVCGVYWHKQTEKWQARIKVDGRFKHLGLFTSIEAAAAARAEASVKYGYTDRHGT